MKHRDEVLSVLRKQISNAAEVEDISTAAALVADKWVKPLSGGKEETNGLIYGLVQSGKTGVLAVTGALGADEGYRTIIVLTSDIDPLYAQTLNRIREAFPGMDILGKSDFKDTLTFLERVKSGTCAIVATKNATILSGLIENFKKGNLKGLSALIIDDEADQASLNTKERKSNGSRSAVNDCIVELRKFFDKNTYLQVTATPQALFLQTPIHDFRPKFTILSYPGSAYVGGDDFFGEKSTLVREFDIAQIQLLSAGAQPHPTLRIPVSLEKALDCFMVAATHKRMLDASQNCAFLCHVSTRRDDHVYIEQLLRKYKSDLSTAVKAGHSATMTRLQAAYDDLIITHPKLKSTDLSGIVAHMSFYLASTTVKVVNGDTDEDVAVLSPYNLFVGGNKLGRGVTIKNLLVSYYGRNPARPQADTVLQHARMYGYRRSDIGLLRLFLPRELHVVFRAIHKMEHGLRELIARKPDEAVRGVYIEGSLKATRSNVLLPGALGIYSGGAVYNPAQVMRDSSVVAATTAIDALTRAIANKSYAEMPLAVIQELIELMCPDNAFASQIWHTEAISESVRQLTDVRGDKTGYVFVDRDRGLRGPRAETQGILSGGEAAVVPTDKVALFLLRLKPEKGEHACWWPQLRFPDGRYAFAFSV